MKKSEKKFFIKNRSGKFLAGSRRVMDKKTGIFSYKKMFTDDFEKAKQYAEKTAKEYCRKDKSFTMVDIDEVIPATMEEIKAIPELQELPETGEGKSYIIDTDSWKFWKSAGDGTTSDFEEAHAYDNGYARDCVKAADRNLLLIDPITFEQMKENPKVFKKAKEVYSDVKGMLKRVEDGEDCICGECEDPAEKMAEHYVEKHQTGLLVITGIILVLALLGTMYLTGFIIGLFS